MHYLRKAWGWLRKIPAFVWALVVVIPAVAVWVQRMSKNGKRIRAAQDKATAAEQMVLHALRDGNRKNRETYKEQMSKAAQLEAEAFKELAEAHAEREKVRKGGAAAIAAEWNRRKGR